MKPSGTIGILMVSMVAVVIFAGCMDSGRSNFNANIPINTFNINTPISVEIGTLTNQNSSDVYLVLRDSNQDMTTAEGVAVITMFKGKYQDNDPDSVNEFVFSETYNVSRDDFHRIDMLTKRDIKQSLLAWNTRLPDEFDPRVFDVYKITIVFMPANINHRLVNQTYIVWG